MNTLCVSLNICRTVSVNIHGINNVLKLTVPMHASVLDLHNHSYHLQKVHKYLILSCSYLFLHNTAQLFILFAQDLLWTMVPQWDFFRMASTPHLPRPWQIHNHCLALTNKRGISGSKVSQWELFRCMREKFGPEVYARNTCNTKVCIWY